MRKFDNIVVGSGISGLTMALILARSGQSVLVIEKAPAPGGSLARFSRKGLHFDTGFHFTGGFEEGGVMRDAFERLGLMDKIQPMFLLSHRASRLIFEREGGDYLLPTGYERVIECLVDYFPSEEQAVRKYFALVREVCDKTPSMKLSNIEAKPHHIDEDFVSLREVLSSMTSNQELMGVIESYAMCYGVRPSEVSFASHARMVMNFYESLAYVKGGGDAIVDAFMSEFETLGVEVMTSTTIEEFTDIRDGVINRYVLSNKEEIEATNCVFTVHPFEVLKMLPEDRLKKAFINRINSYEPSVGFFGVFAADKEGSQRNVDDSTIVSIFPHADVDKLLDPASDDWPGIVAISSVEEAVNGKRPVHLLEPTYPSQVAAWTDTVRSNRPEDYKDYKARHEQNILEALGRGLPELKERLEVVCSGSALSFKDYLNSPDGSAYGVKQKMGQFNLVGRLPLRNLFAAGQSSILPGVMGAMISSFIVAQMLLGQEKYSEFINGNDK